MADDNVLKTTFTVPVGADQFEFKIPTLHDEIRIGSRAQKLRRQIDPEWDGRTELDYNEAVILRACAAFEVLLIRASVNWTFGPDATGKPVCDSSRFPAEKAQEVVSAYEGYADQLRTFRQTGTSSGSLPAEETVANQQGAG